MTVITGGLGSVTRCGEGADYEVTTVISRDCKIVLGVRRLSAMGMP